MGTNMRWTLVISTLSAAVLGALGPGCATTPQTDASEKKSPKNISELYTDMGTQALMRGEFPQAIEDLRKALVAYPDNAVARNQLGLAYYGIGRKELSKEEFERATSLNPRYSDAYINLGNIALDAGNTPLAKHYYRKALENLEYKHRHRALTNLAQLAVRENDFREAKRLLDESLAANPDYCMSHFLLGSIYMRENNPRPAAQEFKKSVASTCTSNVEGHFQLGMAYLKSRDFEKARGQFALLVEQYPQTIQGQKAGDQLRYIP